MKQKNYSFLFLMFVRMGGMISGAGKQKFNILKDVFSRVGIKFDNISTGKLYHGEFGVKKYSWPDRRK